MTDVALAKELVPMVCHHRRAVACGRLVAEAGVCTCTQECFDCLPVVFWPLQSNECRYEPRVAVNSYSWWHIYVGDPEARLLLDPPCQYCGCPLPASQVWLVPFDCYVVHLKINVRGLGFMCFAGYF
jgi:hypothetical protein